MPPDTYFDVPKPVPAIKIVIEIIPYLRPSVSSE